MIRKIRLNFPVYITHYICKIGGDGWWLISSFIIFYLQNTNTFSFSPKLLPPISKWETFMQSMNIFSQTACPAICFWLVSLCRFGVSLIFGYNLTLKLILYVYSYFKPNRRKPIPKDNLISFMVNMLWVFRILKIVLS